MKKIMPPTYFTILLLLLVVLNFVFPIKKIIYSPYTYLGIFPIIFGIILDVWADNLFKGSNTAVKPYETPTKFETSGPFRISRHPMYLGMEAILLGTAIILGSLIAFLPSIIFIFLMEIMFIPFEEKNMEKIFKKNYLDYKKKVKRWI